MLPLFHRVLTLQLQHAEIRCQFSPRRLAIQFRPSRRALAKMSATKPKIKVEVVSDVVCPWCYIGKRRLEKAMAQFSDQAEFDVRWLPYQLNPAAPDEGLGLKYSTGGMTGNTRNAHRLLSWAAAEHGLQKQNALAEQLFSGYHTKEQYINDNDFLLSAAEAAGLPRDAAAAMLDNPAGRGEQLVQQEQGKHAGVNGVPHFVVNGRYRIGGAQPPEQFAEVFAELLRAA